MVRLPSGSFIDYIKSIGGDLTQGFTHSTQPNTENIIQNQPPAYSSVTDFFTHFAPPPSQFYSVLNPTKQQDYIGYNILDFPTLGKSLSSSDARSTSANNSALTTKSSSSVASGKLSGGDPGVLKWSGQIATASQKYGVPQDVIAAIMQNESHGGQYSLSSAGAIGLMQVMPFHFGSGDGDPYDPQTNINKGASILKNNFDMAKQKYGVDDNKAWDIAAAAYLGDWNWSDGAYAGSSDAYGTNGPTYVQKFDEARKQYQVTQQTTNLGGSGPASSSQAQNAISVANGLLGTPYNMVGNANDPRNGYVDCSGLVQWSFKQSGVNLPRTAQEQYDATTHIDASQAQPGDLIFFTQTYDAGVPVTHVGIYLGNNKMIDAQNSGVSIDDLTQPYWQQHLYGFGRVNS